MSQEWNVEEMKNHTDNHNDRKKILENTIEEEMKKKIGERKGVTNKHARKSNYDAYLIGTLLKTHRCRMLFVILNSVSEVHFWA